MKRTMTTIAVLLLGLGLAGAQDLSADEILRRVDANQAYRTVEYAARMEIRLGKELRVKTMRAWAEGADRAVMERVRDVVLRVVRGPEEGAA